MPGGPIMIKILVMGILLLGSLALLTNVLPTSRQALRSRKMLGAVRSPVAVVAAFTGRVDTIEPAESGKVRKTAEEWKAELSDEQYQVTRCSATERPFTGKFWNHHEDGTYTCVGCGQELFTSASKFDSGSGWPSFWQPFDDDHIIDCRHPAGLDRNSVHPRLVRR